MIDIYDRVMDILRVVLTRDEWIALQERMDGDSRDELLQRVCERVDIVAPEVFGATPNMVKERIVNHG